MPISPQGLFFAQLVPLPDVADQLRRAAASGLFHNTFRNVLAERQVRNQGLQLSLLFAHLSKLAAFVQGQTFTILFLLAK